MCVRDLQAIYRADLAQNQHGGVGRWWLEDEFFSDRNILMRWRNRDFSGFWTVSERLDGRGKPNS